MLNLFQCNVYDIFVWGKTKMWIFFYENLLMAFCHSLLTQSVNNMLYCLLVLHMLIRFTRISVLHCYITYWGGKKRTVSTFVFHTVFKNMRGSKWKHFCFPVSYPFTHTSHNPQSAQLTEQNEEWQRLRFTMIWRF